MLNARAAVRTLPAYHPPLGGRIGLRLDFNENTVGCSPRVLERLRRIDLEDLARYPEREPVERAVSEFLGVAADEILLTNGVDEAIHLMCETYLEPDDESLWPIPTIPRERWRRRMTCSESPATRRKQRSWSTKPMSNSAAKHW